MANSYKKLFEHAKIKNMSLRNRMVMSPMGTFSGNHDGFPSSNQVEYYGPGPAAALGMVLVEAQYVTNKTDPWIGYITTADNRRTDERLGHDYRGHPRRRRQGLLAAGLRVVGATRSRSPMTRWYRASEVPSFYFPDRLCRAFHRGRNPRNCGGVWPGSGPRHGGGSRLRWKSTPIRGTSWDQFMTPAVEQAHRRIRRQL